MRKKGKLPHTVIGEDYDLEYGKDRVEIHIDALEKGERVLLVDDLIATGGTALAGIRLLERAGRQCDRLLLCHRPARAGRRRQAARHGQAGDGAGGVRGPLKMKLYANPVSPFARKARIIAHELGSEAGDRPHRLPLATMPEFRRINPLGKIPALVLDDGSVLFDSPVICEYLNHAGGGKFFPGMSILRAQ